MSKLSDFTLYHQAVRDVRGEELLPLNQLRHVHPDIYEREAKKYIGREFLRHEEVLPLGCEWGDVLFFSPVHPAQLLNAVRELGRKVPPMRFYTLNAALLEPERACLKFVKPWKGGVYLPPRAENYAPFTAEVLNQVSSASETTLSRLQNLSVDAPLILWSDVPHVLYRGSLALKALDEIIC